MDIAHLLFLQIATLISCFDLAKLSECFGGGAAFLLLLQESLLPFGSIRFNLALFSINKHAMRSFHLCFHNRLISLQETETT